MEITSVWLLTETAGSLLLPWSEATVKSWLLTFKGPTQLETSPNYMICIVFHVVSSEWCGQRQISSPMTNNGFYYPWWDRFLLTIASSYEKSSDVCGRFSAWTRETKAIIFVKGHQGSNEYKRLQREKSLFFFFFSSTTIFLWHLLKSGKWQAVAIGS